MSYATAGTNYYRTSGHTGGCGLHTVAMCMITAYYRISHERDDVGRYRALKLNNGDCELYSSPQHEPGPFIHVLGALT